MKPLQALGVMILLMGTGFAAVGVARSGAKMENAPAASVLASPGSNDGMAVVAQANVAPPVTTASSPAAIALAKHLKSVGAKMYGAYWCPHCHEQMQLFGRTAAPQLPYIECAEDGKNARPTLCQAAGVEGYPTWKIKGKTLVGTQPLADLADASGFKGSRHF